MTTDTNNQAAQIHSCGYHCDRPECIKAQRDELRDKLTAPQGEAVAWQGLTGQEVTRLMAEVTLARKEDGTDPTFVSAFAAAIEAKLREKNTSPQPAAGWSGDPSTQDYASTQPAAGVEGVKPDAYIVTGLPSGEPDLCFPDEVDDYAAPQTGALCFTPLAVVKAAQPETQVERATVDRSDAVNLARNVMENMRHEAKAVTPKGVQILCDAVLRMDAALLSASPAEREPLTDQATIAGLESSVFHLSRMFDEQLEMLVEVEKQLCVDGHYGAFEDGEHPLCDRIRAHIAAHHIGKPKDVGINGLIESETAAKEQEK